MSIDIKTSRAICDAATAVDVESLVKVIVSHPSISPRKKNVASFIAHARTALPAALDEIERLRSALTIARQGLRNCRYAATPVQADEWATDALLRSAIEEHLAEADTGGKS